MECLADLKRLKVGDRLRLVYSHLQGHRFLNTTRAIEKKQSNAIKFEGGSWLYFPTAAEFKGTNDGFMVMEGDTTFLKYMVVL